MLRILSSFIVGVFVGQEYKDIVNVRMLGEALYEELKERTTTNESNKK